MSNKTSSSGCFVDQSRFLAYLERSQKASIDNLNYLIDNDVISNKDIDESFNEIMNCLLTCGGNTKLIYKAAEYFYAKSYFIQAASILYYYLSIDPDNHEIHWLLASIYMASGYKWDAIHSFEKSMYLASKKNNYWWDGKTNSKTLLVIAPGVGECVIATRQCQELKKFSQKVGIITKSNLIDLAKAGGSFDFFVSTKNPVQDANDFCERNKSLGIKILRTNSALALNESLISHPLKDKNTLFPIQELDIYWKDKINSYRKSSHSIIGICWNTKPYSPMHPDRSFKLEDCKSIAKKKHITLISFQNGYGSEQLNECSFGDKFISCQEEISAKRDFNNTIAAINQCDYFITCDTGIAQVSSALGIRTIVVTIPKPSGMWAGDGTQSTFYDCVYIHRRKLNETWEQCIDRIDIDNIFKS